MDAIADLKQELRGNGTRLGGGGFTIDPLRAREKLEQFRLDDPRRYVVSLVQAAVAAGATAIDFELGARDVTMRAGGLSIELAALNDLETALYSTPRDAHGRAHKHLALAIAAARALCPREIELRSGRTTVLLPARGEPIVSHAAAASAIDGLEVHVRERFGKVAAMRFCRDLFGQLAEERFLREAGVASDVPVRVSGALISRGFGMSAADAVCARAQERPGLRVAVGFGTSPTPQLALYQDGVCIHVVDDWEGVPHTMARIDSDAFSLDISEVSVVRDGSYEAALAALRGPLEDAVVHLAADAEHFEREVPVHGIIRAWLAMAGSPALLQRIASDHPLLTLSLFAHGADGTTELSLGRIRAHHARTGQVETTPVVIALIDGVTSFEPQELSSNLLVLCHDPADEQALRALFGDAVVDGKERFRFRLRRERNHRRWRSRPAAPSLPEMGRYRLVSVPVGAPGVRGELAIEGVRNRPGRATFIKDGHILWEDVVSGPVSGVTFVVEADFCPSDDYGAIEVDDAFARAMVALAAALRDAFEYLVDNYEELRRRLAAADRDPLRHSLLQMAALMTLPGWPSRFGSSYPAYAPESQVVVQAIEALAEELPAPIDLGVGPQELYEVDRLHPLVELRLLRSTSGKHLTLLDACAMLREDGVLRVFRRRVTKSQLNRTSLRASDEEAALLRRLFGRERVVDGEVARIKATLQPHQEGDRQTAVESAQKALASLEEALGPADALDEPNEAGDPVGDAEVEPVRGDALLRAVHDELIWLRANHSGHVETLSLDCISLAPNGAGRAVAVDADGIYLDPRHPLIAGCLANVDDPTPACYLASVVFSAINERWDEITDDHERAFHDALVQRLMVMMASLAIGQQ
ncbi:MAG: hypothetical protein OXR73_09145 [Myxococcales bacterium]|nr:hypothetical protein [Myxococcales bacterium]